MTTSKLAISRTKYLGYYIQAWHVGRLMDAMYAHPGFDDLDLVARSKWVGKVKIISVGCSRQLRKQACYVTLTLQSFIRLIINSIVSVTIFHMRQFRREFGSPKRSNAL